MLYSLVQDVIEKSEINAKAEADHLVNIFILSPPTFEYKKIDVHFCEHRLFLSVIFSLNKLQNHKMN